MLEELDVQNVAVAEHVRLRLADGFIALTGETGAGKSIVIDALSLLVGGVPDVGMVRAGADRARVEGVFRLPEGPDPALLHALAEAGIEPEEGLLIISREVPAKGRAVSRVNGRAVVQSALREIGGRLVDIHGQEDQLSILRPSEHLGFLDRYARLDRERTAVTRLVTHVRGLRAELRRLTDDERERLRRHDRLRFESEEIAAAGLEPDEEDELRAERQILGNTEDLRRLCAAAYSALADGGDGVSAVDALGAAADHLSQLAQLDPRLSDSATQAETLQTGIVELARELRAYRDEVESDPERLAQVETRLTVLNTLKRKYGPTLRDVIDYGEQAARELADLDAGEERAAAVTGEIAAAMAELAVAAQLLTERRRAAAAQLSTAVQREIADLGLAGGRFAVQFERPDAEDGLPSVYPALESIGAGDAPQAKGEAIPRMAAFDRNGVDRVAFLVSLNPGEPLRPLVRVASGGESARLMLALKTILGDADAVPTLVFDEVDVGVGGRSGQVVGRKLAGLGAHHQVLCITHLPQVAARAAQHFAVQKRVQNERTFTEIIELSPDARAHELAAMLGGVTDPNLQSARAMLADGTAGRSLDRAADFNPPPSQPGKPAKVKG